MPGELFSTAASIARLQELAEESQKEYERVQRELREIGVLIRQSAKEVERFAQRDAQITQQLRLLEANLESYPKADIKSAYSAALDVQIRLFMMRSQMEQLQSKQENLTRYAQQLRKFLDVAHELTEKAPAVPEKVAEEEAPAKNIIRIIEAQETERQRLARLIHDGPAQSLTNLILQAEVCERLFDVDLNQARTELSNLKTAVTATFQKTRDFIATLRPMMLDDLGLLTTLRRYVESFEKKHGISTTLVATGQERRFPPYFEVTVFRVLQEALDNVAQHAHANYVRVSLDFQPSQVTMTIEDDGTGFDVAKALEGGQQRPALGLVSMKERVEMLGGVFQIESGIGRGTHIKVILPAEEAAPTLSPGQGT